MLLISKGLTFTSLYREWWRFHLSEIFSTGALNNSQHGHVVRGDWLWLLPALPVVRDDWLWFLPALSVLRDNWLWYLPALPLLRADWLWSDFFRERWLAMVLSWEVNYWLWSCRERWLAAMVLSWKVTYWLRSCHERWLAAMVLSRHGWLIKYNFLHVYQPCL